MYPAERGSLPVTLPIAGGDDAERRRCVGAEREYVQKMELIDTPTGCRIGAELKTLWCFLALFSCKLTELVLLIIVVIWKDNLYIFVLCRGKMRGSIFFK